MSFTVFDINDENGQKIGSQIIGHLESSVTTNVILHPPSFEESLNFHGQLKTFTFGYTQEDLQTFQSAVNTTGTHTTLSMNNSVTNPLEFTIRYIPQIVGHNVALLTFRDVLTNEVAELRVCGKKQPDGIVVEIIDANNFGNLGIVDGVSTNRIDEVDGMDVSIVI
tara:strand:+ start:26 stop:523 length:498 start_codon:yes stop_codon:yes gene_type:complete